MSEPGLPSGAERELATFLERWLGREEVPRDRRPSGTPLSHVVGSGSTPAGYERSERRETSAARQTAACGRW